MIKEHDRVILSEAIEEHGLEPGDIGEDRTDPALKTRSRPRCKRGRILSIVQEARQRKRDVNYFIWDWSAEYAGSYIESRPVQAGIIFRP